MSTWAILATGPSMSYEVAQSVRGKCGVIAVSNAYVLAPWADALVSVDAAWWRAHPAALDFAGRKFCAARWRDVEIMPSTPPFTRESNSGLRAMGVARDVFKAEKILLLGFDLHGQHFFGRHQPPLYNANQKRLDHFAQQFRRWRGPTVINCTPGSHLKHFPFGTLEEALA